MDQYILDTVGWGTKFPTPIGIINKLIIINLYIYSKQVVNKNIFEDTIYLQ